MSLESCSVSHRWRVRSVTGTVGQTQKLTTLPVSVSATVHEGIVIFSARPSAELSTAVAIGSPAEVSWKEAGYLGPSVPARGLVLSSTLLQFHRCWSSRPYMALLQHSFSRRASLTPATSAAQAQPVPQVSHAFR